jgi:hypothetical protein
MYAEEATPKANWKQIELNFSGLCFTDQASAIKLSWDQGLTTPYFNVSHRVNRKEGMNQTNNVGKPQDLPAEGVSDDD